MVVVSSDEILGKFPGLCREWDGFPKDFFETYKRDPCLARDRVFSVVASVIRDFDSHIGFFGIEEKPFLESAKVLKGALCSEWKDIFFRFGDLREDFEAARECSERILRSVYDCGGLVPLACVEDAAEQVLLLDKILCNYDVFAGVLGGGGLRVSGRRLALFAEKNCSKDCTLLKYL